MTAVGVSARARARFCARRCALTLRGGHCEERYDGRLRVLLAAGRCFVEPVAADGRAVGECKVDPGRDPATRNDIAVTHNPGIIRNGTLC